MEAANNPPGAGSPPDRTGGPVPSGQGQSENKMNPMSPGFMATGGGQQSPLGAPSGPPAGGTPAAPPPPPPPPSPPPAGGQGGAVPPPPPKEVDIRTMAGDQESLKKTGGLGVTSATVKPITPKGEKPKKIDSAGKTKRPSGTKKALLIGIVVLVLLAAAAAVANYFVIPLLLPEVEVSEPPVVEIEEPAPPPPVIPTFTHESYFDGSITEEVEVVVQDVDALSIASAVGAAAQSALARGDTLTEFYVTTGGASAPVTSGAFFSVMLPDVTLITPLENDFTGFLYNDGEKVWSGYVFALPAGAEDKDLMKSILEEDLEASNSLTNLYLDDPGAPSAEGFKDGTATGELVGVRYLPFEAEGASFNYGWKGDRLVLSTSFAGFKAVADKIGETAAEAPAEEVGDTATTTE